MRVMSTKRLGWTIRPWQLGDHPSTRSLSESCFRLVCSYEAQTMSVRPARQEREHYQPIQGNSQLLRKSSPLLLKHFRHFRSDLGISSCGGVLVMDSHIGGLMTQTIHELSNRGPGSGSHDRAVMAEIVR